MKKSANMLAIILMAITFFCGVVSAEEKNVTVDNLGNITNPQADPVWKRMLNSGGDPETSLFFVLEKDILPGTTKISRYTFEWAGENGGMQWETTAHLIDALYAPNSALGKKTDAYIKKNFNIGERVLRDYGSFLIAEETFNLATDPAGRIILVGKKWANSVAKPLLTKKDEEAIESLGVKVIFNDSQIFLLQAEDASQVQLSELEKKLVNILPKKTALKISFDASNEEEGKKIIEFKSVD